MKVSEAMSSPAATCHRTTTLAAAALQMLRHDCGILPVVEEGRGLVGVVTDRDICMAVGTRGPEADAMCVESIMTTTLQTVAPGATLEEALERMAHAHVHRLPVVDERWTLFGMISVSDIVLARGTAIDRDDLPSCEAIIAAMRGIYAHWRPHTLGAHG